MSKGFKRELDFNPGTLWDLDAILPFGPEMSDKGNRKCQKCNQSLNFNCYFKEMDSDREINSKILLNEIEEYFRNEISHFYQGKMLVGTVTISCISKCEEALSLQKSQLSPGAMPFFWNQIVLMYEQFKYLCASPEKKEQYFSYGEFNNFYKILDQKESGEKIRLEEFIKLRDETREVKK